MPFFNSFLSLFLTILCLSFRVQHAHCIGIKFTSPAPGAVFPAGNVSITWADAGGVPGMSNLTTYNLALIVGGITATDSKQLAIIGGTAPQAMIKDGSVQANIPADIGQSIQNGYYLCMMSNTTNGNEVINYSARFTIIDMNGTTDQVYVTGAATSVGDNNVPGEQQIVNSQPAAAATTSSTATATTPASTSTGTSAFSPISTSSSAAGERFSISGGALAGLAIGTLTAVVLFLILAAMILVWWRKRRRLRKIGARRGAGEEDSKSPDTVLQNWGDKVELSARPTSTLPRSRLSPAELSPEQERHEVGEREPTAELAATTEVVYELEGDFSGWEMAARRSRHGAYDPTL